MNFLDSKQQQISNSGLLQSSSSQFNTGFAAFTQLQIELFNTQKTLKSLREENDSLKTMVIELQSRIINLSCNQNTESQTRSVTKEDQMTNLEKAQIETKQSIQTNNILPFCPKTEKGKEKEQLNQKKTIKDDEADEKETFFTSPDLNIKIEDESVLESDDEYTPPKVPIRRRNGFKRIKDSKENGSDNKGQKKGERPRAKHLWITYGRKIVEYSAENSRGALREKIERCTRLESKKGYSEVFLLRDYDTEEENEFKKRFGKLALEFLEKGVDDAFLNSNYRDELLAQRPRVRNWIKKLIKEE